MGFKDIRREKIVNAAKKLFLEKSISETTIRDISVACKLGEATVYRYFENKENLATAVSLSIQKDLLNIPFSNSNKNGIEQIEDFFSLFKKVFLTNKNYYKFIAEFDAVYLNTIQSIESQAYSTGLDAFFDVFIRSYEKGLEDKSIKEIKDVKVFYYTSTHSLLELCKKHASISSNLKQDLEVSKLEEIEYLISLFISVLKA